MVEPISPLSGASSSTADAADPGITGAEYGNMGYIVVRGRTADEQFVAGFQAVLGVVPPAKPRSVTRCDAGVVLWQSPDEWWLVCGRADRDEIFAALSRTLADCFAQVVDSSGGFTSVHLEGPHWTTLLRHLAPYDFSELEPLQCVSTAVGKASFTVVRDAVGGATLVFRRSFADYIWRLVDRAARPYGLRLVPSTSAQDGLFSMLLAEAPRFPSRRTGVREAVTA